MGMKLKSGADLCGFQLTNFCVQGEASAPSDAALGRKYFHTNATDDVATGISLLNRERIYLGEGAWRATAYLDDIAAINEKLNLITGDTDTDTLINNLKDLEEFLKDFSETDKLKSLLDGKLDKSGGTIKRGSNGTPLVVDTDGSEIGLSFRIGNTNKGWVGYASNIGTYIYDYTSTKYLGIRESGTPFYYDGAYQTLIHSGNIGSQSVASANKVTTADGLNALGGDSTTLRVGYGYRNLTTNIYGNEIYFAKNGAITMLINESGNVTIGASDLAGTTYKLHVDGKIRATSAIYNSRWVTDGAGAGFVSNKGGTYYFGFGASAANGNNASFGLCKDTAGTWQQELMTFVESSGNVLIGNTTDDESGAKLQVDGGCITIKNGTAKTYSYIRSGNYTNNTARLTIGTCYGYGVESDAIEIYHQDVRIKGNLIVDGEVSAGGAGAEGGTSGSGSAEGVSEIFTPTSTSMAFDHNLGEDVIVQVYEKNNSVWNLVMVDVEITSATRVTLRFGKTETTQHKVVIMGV